MTTGVLLLRAADRLAERQVSGTAVAYDVPHPMPGGRSESYAPGVFRNLASPHIRFTREHSDRLLARSGSGNLRLFDSPRALEFKANLPRTADADAVIELARRGDYPGVSIGFYPLEEEASKDGRHRRITAANLEHIAVVSNPCLDTATLETNSRTTGGLEIRHFPAPALYNQKKGSPPDQ